MEENKKYPLVIHLHGAGGRGDDISVVETHPFFMHAMPFIENCFAVAPQCYADSWFDILEQLIDFTEFVISDPDVDKDRVYLAGASMGGYAVWQLAMSRPLLFAAIIPICGGGMYWNAARLKDIPVWAFHGENDEYVLPEESVKMVNAVNSAGGSAKLTLYENTDHNAWEPTYKNREVFEWLFSCVKNERSDERTALEGTKEYG